MLIGHLPAAILASRAYVQRNGSGMHQSQKRLLVWAGILAGVMPDLDLLYYYFVDNCQNNHHSYWTHFPVFWTLFLAPFLLLIRKNRETFLWHLVAVVYMNCMIHMGLDTVVGKIQWALPFTDTYYAFFEVVHRYRWWVWDFVFHWTFILEIAIWYLCLWTFLDTRNSLASLIRGPVAVFRQLPEPPQN